MVGRNEPFISLEAVPVRRITHITAGNADWVPDDEQLKRLTKEFQEAEVGNGIFATRSGVRIHSVVVAVPDETARCEQWVISAALAYTKSPDGETRENLGRATAALNKLREQTHVCGV